MIYINSMLYNACYLVLLTLEVGFGIILTMLLLFYIIIDVESLQHFSDIFSLFIWLLLLLYQLKILYTFLPKTIINTTIVLDPRTHI